MVKKNKKQVIKIQLTKKYLYDLCRRLEKAHECVDEHWTDDEKDNSVTLKFESGFQDVVNLDQDDILGEEALLYYTSTNYVDLGDIR